MKKGNTLRVQSSARRRKGVEDAKEAPNISSVECAVIPAFAFARKQGVLEARRRQRVAPFQDINGQLQIQWCQAWSPRQMRFRIGAVSHANYDRLRRHQGLEIETEGRAHAGPMIRISPSSCPQHLITHYFHCTSAPQVPVGWSCPVLRFHAQEKCEATCFRQQLAGERKRARGRGAEQGKTFGHVPRGGRNLSRSFRRRNATSKGDRRC